MKKKLLLALFVIGGCLSSCQQTETMDVIEEQEFSFEAVTDGATTRSMKKKIDVISLCANTEKQYSAFDLAKDKRSWKDYKNETKFFAHFPKLSSNEELESEREIEGGKDYLFGAVEPIFGSSSVGIRFKNMAAQIYIIVRNEDGTLSNPKLAKIKLKNKGKQNLKTGLITLLESIAPQMVKFDKTEDGLMCTIVLPQKIKDGTVVEFETEDGETGSVTVEDDVDLEAGETYQMVLSSGSNRTRVATIYDPLIPLEK